MQNYNKKTTKLTCTMCHGQFASNKITGDKCKTCIEVMIDRDIHKKNYNYQRYHAPDFKLNTLNKSQDLTKLGDIANHMSNNDKMRCESTMQMIENENKKSKISYDMEIKDNIKPKKNKYKNMSNKQIDYDKSVISQIIKNKNSIKNESKTEKKMTQGMLFD